MFPTVKICILFTIFMSETSGTLGQGQRRQSQEPVDPIMIKNAINTGQMLVQLGKQSLRELSEITSFQSGGLLLFRGYETEKNPSLGYNLITEFEQIHRSVDPILLKNIITTGQILVKLGKQKLRELSHLSGIQIGGDLLFSNYELDRNPTFAINSDSNLNSSLHSSTTTDFTQKSTPDPHKQPPLQPTHPSAPPATTAFSSTAENNNELVYQPVFLPTPQLLENAQTPQTPTAFSVPAPPYKGSYNPLAEDDFHVSFSVLNPTLGSKKITDPLLYPVQFYSPEALHVASLQENPEVSTSNHQSNYDNFDAW